MDFTVLTSKKLILNLEKNILNLISIMSNVFFHLVPLVL